MSINEDKSQRICGELSVSLPLIVSKKVEIYANSRDDFINLTHECIHRAVKDFAKTIKGIHYL